MQNLLYLSADNPNHGMKRGNDGAVWDVMHNHRCLCYYVITENSREICKITRKPAAEYNEPEIKAGVLADKEIQQRR